MKGLLLTVLLLCLTCKVLAQNVPVNVKDGLALNGYDPVSYFEDGGPVLGSGDLSATFRGATYRFSTVRHREEFRNDPTSFLPEYGGWCAYAMGIDGERVEVDPKTYKMKDGRLFLFYNGFLNNTLKKWNEREEVLLPRADLNWNNQLKTNQDER